MGQTPCSNACGLNSGQSVDFPSNVKSGGDHKYAIWDGGDVRMTPSGNYGAEIQTPKAAAGECAAKVMIRKTNSRTDSTIGSNGHINPNCMGAPSGDAAAGAADQCTAIADNVDSYSASYFGREAAEFAAMPANLSKVRVRRRHEFKTGAVYDGEWLGNDRDGAGIQKWPDGAQYEGEWSQNLATGRGCFKHADGDMYIGDWSRNTAHGHGVYKHRDSTTYEGQFVDDLQDGSGVESWPDKSKFLGQFRQGKKSGHGVYVWPDGSEYAGQWDQNQIDGVGAYTGADERQFMGRWQTSTMHGCGRYCWPDGRSYRGQYFWDQKDGFGIFKWADNRRYEGFWSGGRQHGMGRLVNEGSGTTKLAEWVAGERICVYEDGKEGKAP